MLNWISPRLRITLGLASIVVSVLLFGTMLGIIPDHERTVMEARGDLCETIAVAGCQLIANGDAEQLETLLGFVVERNQDVISSRIRNAQGETLVVVGPHEWVEHNKNLSDDSQILVPLRTSRGPWGGVEIKFKALHKTGWLGWISNSRYRLFAFAGASLAVAFFFYLSRILRQLDPSRAVPPHVRAALDTIADGLLLLDANERIAFANSAFADKLGVPAESLQGVDAAKLPWTAECLEEIDQFPWTDGIPDEDRQGVLLKVAADGRPERVLQTNASVVSQEGKYYGALVSLDDVTVLEQTKVELKKSKLAADDANRAKSEFLARMSHEIRTPMTAILGFADVLRRGYETDPEERQEYLETIHSSGAHLLELINDILDLSKVESGKMELDKMAYSPASIINEVTGILGVRAREKNVDLSYSFDTPIPETINTDAVRLRQALTNLVGNAIKFTEEGEVHVGVSLDQTGDEPMLIIDVADTGIGIPADKLDKVFSPFAQADTSITRRFGGTGLGLAISRKLARALGGDLTVQSEVGKGSIFTCQIATGDLTDVALIEAERVELSGKKTQTELSGLDGGRFLMADDGESNRRLVTIVLKRLGAEVDSVENGKLAVDAVEAGEYDAILMDMQMPVMDGFTATQELRKRGCTIPIIALTADAVGDAQAKCLAAGCSHYLSKPIEMEKLSGLLSELSRPTSDDSATETERADWEPNPKSSEESVVETPKSTTQISAAIKPPQQSKPTVAGLDTKTNRTNELPKKQKAESAKPETTEALEVLGSVSPPKDKVEKKPITKTPVVEVKTEPAAQKASNSVAATADDPVVEVPTKPTVKQKPAAKSKKPVASGPDIIPELPMDDPEFRSIAEDFMLRLDEQLEEMETALENEDFQELGNLAHWLRGAGGTVGIPAFTEPARLMESHAENQLVEELENAVRELRGIQQRVRIPSAQSV